MLFAEVESLRIERVEILSTIVKLPNQFIDKCPTCGTPWLPMSWNSATDLSVCKYIECVNRYQPFLQPKGIAKFLSMKIRLKQISVLLKEDENDESVEEMIHFAVMIQKSSSLKEKTSVKEHNNTPYKDDPTSC